MDKKEIFDTVSSIVADHFDVDRAKITDDLNLKTDLNADSIDFVEFVLEVEDTFGAEIEDSEAEKLSTIGEVVTSPPTKRTNAGTLKKGVAKTYRGLFLQNGPNRWVFGL